MSILRVIVEHLANLEFQLSSDQSRRKKQFFREKYLQYMAIEYRRPVYFGQDIYIRNKGNLSIGQRCSIGSFTRIWNYAPIIIGDDFLGAGNLVINSGIHDIYSLKPGAKQVTIGDRVWCGVSVTILAGVSIGNDVVVGAGSLVITDIPNGTVVVGVPAKKIKSIQRSDVKVWSPFT